MPRESEFYRDNLARVEEAFPDKEALNVTEVSKWWGVSTRVVTQQIGLHKGEYITKATLARKMAVLHENRKR